MYDAQIIADSLSPEGVRLTTFEVEWPHGVHKDFMTHSALVRNFLSFRAYPPEKLFKMLEVDPFIPSVFYERATGMNHGKPLEDQEGARQEYVAAFEATLEHAKNLLDMGASKDQVNFLLQDYCWIRGVVTATEWDNFFGLRADPDNVRPEVGRVARMMQLAYRESDPQPVYYGEWHLPFTDDREDLNWSWWKQVSAGRTARVSYMTHHGIRDQVKDVDLHDNLLNDGHMSPFGHQATPFELTGPKYIYRKIGNEKYQFDGPDWSGQFYGWAQYRKSIPFEHDFRMMRKFRGTNYA